MARVPRHALDNGILRASPGHGESEPLIRRPPDYGSVVVVVVVSLQNRLGSRVSTAASSAATHAAPFRAGYEPHSGLSALGFTEDSHFLSMTKAVFDSI